MDSDRGILYSICKHVHVFLQAQFFFPPLAPRKSVLRIKSPYALKLIIQVCCWPVAMCLLFFFPPPPLPLNFVLLFCMIIHSLSSVCG